MSLRAVRLTDKYDLSCDRVFVSGAQAAIRLLLMQRARDREDGLNTAAFVSGYRGSPLGGFDQQLWRAREILLGHNIVFQPGLNEDLAATAIWGAQQAELRGEGQYDGVFGLWYGKGPGVDRSGDALRHANFAGTSPHGGVLALMGDDHTCESSTTAHQSEFAFVDAMMPILNPAGVQEILDFGLYGWALSRFAGVWVGLKCIKDNIESTASIDGSLNRIATVRPEFSMPPPSLNGGTLNITSGTHPLDQEWLLHEFKKPAALAFLRANPLDRIIWQGGQTARLGIASLGKSWLDTLQALKILGIDQARGTALGIRLYKIAVPWPLEPTTLASFAEGLGTIIVVEEKRSLVETQIKEQLFGAADAPQVIGKKDERHQTLFPSHGALDANDVAIALGRRILALCDDPELAARIRALEEAQDQLRQTETIAVRVPYYCSGCPHSTSTRVPEGSRAYAGIGCHYLAQGMDRATDGYTHMGAEGANWLGEAPFSKRSHVFQNLGDGTYNHSGILALRAAVAAGVNITYKILFNDAVALTGGQPMEGDLSVPMIARQVAAEGVCRIAIVSDKPEKYPADTAWPAFSTRHHRSELDALQRELAQLTGVSVLIYDQTCAAELRRRRKRGVATDPDRRVVINTQVCEGCGDCGQVSNCVSIQPLDTEFGRKRTIDQSSCNKDFSCVDGFCPSFVTVEGGVLRRGRATTESLPTIPEPRVARLAAPFGLLITGVGGTGVVTVGAILGMAAHLDGYGVGLIDMAGLAQKGGAVTTHMKIAPDPSGVRAVRVAASEADTVLACDIVVAGSQRVLSAIKPGSGLVFVNTHETYPGTFTRNVDFTLPSDRLKAAFLERAGDRAHFIGAHRLATALTGDAIATNLFMTGFAWQRGGIPLSRAAIEKAIQLNGVAVEMNIAAFHWGRYAGHNLEGAAKKAGIMPAESAVSERDGKSLVERYTQFLTAYQDAAYADRYRRAVARIAEAEERVMPGRHDVTDTAARALFKLMAVKDEYEVARLYTDGTFDDQLAATFERYRRLQFHLAPTIFARRDPVTGRLEKKTFGPWILYVFRAMAKLRPLRGTWADPFAHAEDRKLERRLLREYDAALEVIAETLSAENYDTALALATYPLKIRGFGHVKAAQARAALHDRGSLMATMVAAPSDTLVEAAE